MEVSESLNNHMHMELKRIICKAKQLIWYGGTDRQTHRHTDTQTDRQTDRQTLVLSCAMRN